MDVCFSCGLRRPKLIQTLGKFAQIDNAAPQRVGAVPISVTITDAGPLQLNDLDQREGGLRYFFEQFCVFTSRWLDSALFLKCCNRCFCPHCSSPTVVTGIWTTPTSVKIFSESRFRHGFGSAPLSIVILWSCRATLFALPWLVYPSLPPFSSAMPIPIVEFVFVPIGDVVDVHRSREVERRINDPTINRPHINVAIALGDSGFSEFFSHDDVRRIGEVTGTSVHVFFGTGQRDNGH